MAIEKTAPDQFWTKAQMYRARSEIEGKVIVVACLAAAKIFNSPVYKDHRMFPIQVVIGDRFISIEAVKRTINVGTLKEVMRVLPENTSFFQVCLVRFKSFSGDVTINLDGKLERRRVQWRIRSVFAPAYPELLTEEELAGFW